MRRLALIWLALSSLACGAQEEAPVVITVRSVDLDPDESQLPALDDRSDPTVLNISLRNTSNGYTPLAAPLFVVELDTGIEVLGSPRTELLDNGCRADSAVASGAVANCSLVLERPAGTLPIALYYQLADGSRFGVEFSVCEPTETLCDRACVDLTTDHHHCGACFDEVASGAACVDGEAVCRQDWGSICDDQCTDLDLDPLNCGACGAVVPDGTVCVDGSPGCIEGLTLCGDTCVDLQTDPSNCGVCGATASTGFCDEGAVGCVAFKQLCDGECVSRSDPNHCGDCGISVEDLEGSYCNGGSLKCPDETPDVCDDTCVDLDADPNHCGACGRQCQGPGTCESGRCSFQDTAVGPQTCNDVCDDHEGYACQAAALVCGTAEEIGCDEGGILQDCTRHCLCVLD
ncbi:MAG: hypothetical protein AAGA54_04660 [Myxococcota bacterium]